MWIDIPHIASSPILQSSFFAEVYRLILASL